MKRVARRLDRLEDRLAPQGRKQFLIVVTDAPQKLALDSSTCMAEFRRSTAVYLSALFDRLGHHVHD